MDDLKTKESIFIAQDDNVTFHKSPEYWDKAVSAINAYSELIIDPPRQLDFEGICYWLSKYSDLNGRIGNFNIFKPNMKWSPFSSLYADLFEYRNYIMDHELEIKQANNSLNFSVTEEKSIEWVLKYEALYELAPFDLKYTFVKEDDHYLPENLNSFILIGEQFIQTISFIDYYQKKDESLLKKYITYTKDEHNEAFNNENYQNENVDVLSLRFHLARRKALAEIGIDLPFFLILD